MVIRNKHESDLALVRKDLNRLDARVIDVDDNIQSKLKEYFSTYKCNGYDCRFNVRDRTNATGKFLYNKTRDEILEEISVYNNGDQISIFESLAEADSRLILQGDIELTKDYQVIGALSDVKNISNRKAMEQPVYHISYCTLTEPDPKIRGIKELVDFLYINQLFGVVTELSLFEIPVGIKRENIIVWEVRNY